MNKPFILPSSKWLMLPLLSLLLGSCGGTSTSTVPATPTYTLSGHVVVSSAAAHQAQSQSLKLAAQSLSLAPWNAPHVTGQVLVLGSGITPQSLSLAGVQLHSVPNTDISVAQTPSGQSDQDFAAQLAQRGLQVQPNYLYQPLTIPNDPGYPSNAGIRVGSDSGNPLSSAVVAHQDYLSRIGAQAGWDALSTAQMQSGVITAILDSGADYSHSDLTGRLMTGADCSAVTVLSTTTLSACTVSSSAAQDTDGHGTSSAGLIGATGNNKLGLTGLTWGGKNLLPIKVFAADGASTTALAAALHYAVAQKAKVINMSLGLTGAIGSTDAGDIALAQAISKTAAADVVMVAAAGNTPNDGLYYPASDPNVLAVGAVGSADTLACYSARPKAGQKALDLVAPGGNAGTGTDNCFVQGGADDMLTLALKSSYTLSAGTSEAAPLVSGTAALMRAARPDLSASQISQLLKDSATVIAGGKLLNVGAAIKAALNAPTNGAATTPSTGSSDGTVTVPITPVTPRYTVTVTAQNVTTRKSYTATSASSSLPATVPYTISNLPAGNYTVQAKLVYNAQTYSGQSSVTLSANTTQDITVN